MPKLKILTCAFTCCPPGSPGFTGGESLLGWSIVNQVARVHEVWTLTWSSDRVSIEQGITEGTEGAPHFIYVGLPTWLNFLLRFQGGHQLYYYFWQIKAYFVARKLHKTVGFDLFHHVTYANDWMASFIGANLNIPYVRGPGGGAQRTPKGFESEYPIAGRIWEKFRSGGQWLFRHDPLYIKGQRRASALLLCNKESMAHVPSKWLSKVHFYPVNGITDRDLEVATNREDRPSHFRLLSAGSLIQVKGFGLAIKAFKGLVESHPESELTIIGSGPDEGRLREAVRRLSLDSKVRILPEMPRDELLANMGTYDVFLFAGLREGGGAVVLEAMAAGIPVVCLDVGGPSMHVTEDSGVKIIPKSVVQTTRELTQALQKLHNEEELASRLGTAARERVEQYYLWDKLGERLMGIYSDALDESKEHC